ncbi:MAG: cytidine deaminase, partial [Microcystis aeruginosa Ma_AC_P_19900807_S299]
SSGIKEVFYEADFNSGTKAMLRDSFLETGIIKYKKIYLSAEMASHAALFLLNPISIDLR